LIRLSEQIIHDPFDIVVARALWPVFVAREHCLNTVLASEPDDVFDNRGR
jgi:hypothetical protein